MKNILPIFIALIIAACTDGLSQNPPTHYVYSCDDETKFIADYDSKGGQVTVYRSGYPPLIMIRTISGSGERYRNRNEIFHIKGIEGSWITNENTRLKCYLESPSG